MAVIPPSIPRLTDEKSITGETYTVYVFTFQGLNNPVNSVLRVVGPSSINISAVWNNRPVNDASVTAFLSELYQAGFVGVKSIESHDFRGAG